jgi:hypothetical protein
MPRRKKSKFPIVIVAVIVVYAAAAAAFMYVKESSLVSMPAPFGDEPPLITFTWSPEGAVDLKSMKAHLCLTDDRALDFTTYRLTIVEVAKTLDFPVAGVVGRDYDTDLSFSWLASDPRLTSSKQLTVTVSIADDQGQKSSLTRVIPLMSSRISYPRGVQERLDRAAAMDTSPSP